MFRKKQTQPARPFCSAVVVAAGSGTRMGTDKLMLQLGGCTVMMFGAIIVSGVTEGGADRTASAWAGVQECSEQAGLIAIHDAARPLVTEEIIERAVTAAAERGAAAPAIHVKDTVRQARGGRVLRTLERDELYLMQTPQVFRAELIRQALGEAARLGISLTDDCAAVMLLDAEVFLVEGSEENLKLTTPADIYAASAIIDARGEFM